MRSFILSAVLGIACAITSPLGAEPVASSLRSYEAQPVLRGLKDPWAFGFLPDGTILVTEIGGTLTARLPDGSVKRVAGLPKVRVQGQGGLLDLLIPQDFSRRREIFMTYAKRQGVRQAGTAVLRARLSDDLSEFTELRTIFEIKQGSTGGRHFGSRLVEARDGTLFVTVGERGAPNSAQDLTLHNGSVLRITRDGKAPRDNPFSGHEDKLPEIWSYGHRNPQGAALDPTGQLWVNEHGAMGGDEVNRIRKGSNYGWPVIAYGRNYNGTKIGEGTAKPGMEQPDFYWDPSIAPSGMTIHSGKGNAAWRGHFFVGSLKFDYIARLEGTPLREVEQIKGDATIRVRDVREGPDGGLWFLSVGNGTLYRLVP